MRNRRSCLRMAVFPLCIAHRNLTRIILCKRNTGVCQFFLMRAGHGHSAGDKEGAVFRLAPGNRISMDQRNAPHNRLRTA